MNRRAFFRALAACATTATLDPERLLWVPGKKKLISIPAPFGIHFQWDSLSLYDSAMDEYFAMYSAESVRRLNMLYPALRFPTRSV